MSPLSKIWTAVESVRLSQDDSVEVDLKEIQEFVEQTVLLLGQASNSISYYRIFYMLLALTNSPQQSSKMLREDSASPEKRQQFISEKVPWKHLAHLQIKKANHRNVTENIASKIQTLSSRPSPDTEKEFRRATTTKASSQERNDVQYSKKRCNNGKQNSYGYGYGKYKPGNLLQKSGISLCSSSGGYKTDTSLHKKLILYKKNSKCAVSRKVKKIYRKPKHSDK